MGENQEGKESECHRSRCPVHRQGSCGCPGLGTKCLFRAWHGGVHNPSIHKAKAGGSEFKVTLDYIVRVYLKRRTVVHTFSPSTREEEAGRSL